MSNLSNNIQNIEASRSSIEDADFAAEAADLAKNQILAQSATAMQPKHQPYRRISCRS